MRRRAPPRALLLALGGLIAPLGCDGTDVGNPATDVEFTLKGEAAAATIDGAWLVAAAIRLQESGQCGDAAPPAQELVGPFYLDLFASEPVPPLAGLHIAGDYCQLEVSWDVGAEPLPSGPPADLVGVTAVVTGERSDGTPFVIRSAVSSPLVLVPAAGRTSFAVDAASHVLFVAFDAGGLLDGVDLDAAVVEGGRIRVEVGSNDALLTRFQANVDRAAALFDDNDGNGRLDTGERVPGEALAVPP